MGHLPLKKIACIADPESVIAMEAHAALICQYDLIDLNQENNFDFDVVVALGGDGLMLKVMHKFMRTGIPIYGMNRGSIGFLMNPYSEKDLLHRIASSMPITLFPLEMRAETVDGHTATHIAINEISLMRQTIQSSKLRISVNGKEELSTLVCDGILVATPAGSTAYNIAANGPILPLTANLLAMTPICAFRPRRWRGTLLSNDCKIEIESISPDKRPVSASADFLEVRNIHKVAICERQDLALNILFDQGDSLQHRILKEQFAS